MLFMKRFTFLILLMCKPSYESDITATEIDKIIEEYTDILKSEKNSTPSGIFLEENDPSYLQRFQVIERFSDVQRIFETISEKIGVNDLPEDESPQLTEALNDSESYKDLLSKCLALHTFSPCDEDSPFRTYDGTCNNLKNPLWGSAFMCYERMLPPVYEGMNGFRKALSGNLLPETRDLSVGILKNNFRTEKSLTHMFMYFGQLVAHDILDTPSQRINGVQPTCCPIRPGNHPECGAIPLREDDPFFSQFNRTCMDMTRRAPCATCTFGKRTHINNVPSFIDCNFVYGRGDEEAKSLRMNDSTGKLLSQKTTFGELLLGNKSEDDTTCPMGETSECFTAGDARVNQNSVLISLHTVYAREHNRLAEELAKINPHWDGEQIYQIARQINTAQFQNAIYKDYLPLLVGPELMDEFKLWLDVPFQYDDDVNPTALAEFIGFAFRLHGFINTQVGKRGCADMKFRDTLSNLSSIHDGCVESFLEDTCQVPAHKFGRYISEDMSKFIDRVPGGSYGNDLAAANIYRGRDHGLRPYVDYISLWSKGDLNITSFDDLTQVMSKGHVDLLRQYYEDVRDVDAYIGMHLEDHIPDSPIGGTAAYVIAQQFHNLKFGDRYFFQNEGQFTPEQYDAIRQSSFPNIVCDNTNIISMPKNAFIEPNPWNYVPCKNMPRVDLTHWKESDK